MHSFHPVNREIACAIPEAERMGNRGWRIEDRGWKAEINLTSSPVRLFTSSEKPDRE
jgi:hypothetical protein